jgi:DsbC/DsbD-like thiol-disulfide interchange protein
LEAHRVGDPEPPADQEYQARPRLVTENARLRAGQTEWIGVTFTMQDNWHIYWPGQNDSGFPAEFEFTLSVEGEVGEPVWPAPVRYFPAEGLLDHVYEKQVTIMFPLVLAEQATHRESGEVASQEVTISVVADWLVCKEECIPEGASLSLTVPVVRGESAVSQQAGSQGKGDLAGPDAPLFEAARQRHPEVWSNSGAQADSGTQTDSVVQAVWKDRQLVFSAPGSSKLAFYPADDSLQVVNLIKTGETTGTPLTLDFKDGSGPVRGILEIWGPASGNRPGKSRVYAVEFEQPGQ